jgi:subtilisin family serine protease
VKAGVVVVAAAGNEPFPLCGYPAIAQDVVCVGATDRRDVNTWYGNIPWPRPAPRWSRQAAAAR